jgi:predicted NAD/FAD-binding protein
MSTNAPGQKIAIIGSGIAGLTVAYLLSKHHQVTLFEKNDYLGGHTHTRLVQLKDKVYPVDTGFIVFNNWTYPNFIKLLNQLGVASEPSDMSFSVHCEASRLEYKGTNLNTLFAQRSNLFKPYFWRMIWDILRFNKQALRALTTDSISEQQTLGDFISQQDYSAAFINNYIIPMGAAIWSASTDSMLAFPARFFLQFFNNHGLLNLTHRPEWRVISNGSHSYIKPLTKPYQNSIHVNTPTVEVSRSTKEVKITTQSKQTYHFDQVVFACHSDQALAMLANPTQLEREVLASLPYQKNKVVLHTDTRLMPKRQLAWASWNYYIPQQAKDRVTVTYHMNKLQNLHEAPAKLLVTLNPTQAIDANKIIAEYQYNHPIFTLAGIKAQQRHHEISGHHRSHYCGAYWFNGFHEDGVNSALRVAKHFGASL